MSNVIVQKSTMPKGWGEVKLEEIAAVHYGQSLIKNKRLGGDVPVYSSAGLIDWHNIAYVNNSGLIIGRKGTIGSVYKSNKPFFPIDTTFYISEKDIDCDLDFLFYALSNRGLNELNSDSAVPGLNRNTLLAQEIKLPLLLSEQKAIAEMLSSLNDKIELLRRQNKTLESMAQTLFRKWFIEGIKNSWKKGKLEDIISTIESGKRPKGGINQNLKEGYPSIGAESINGIGIFDFKETKFISKEFFNSLGKGIVKDYDVLIYKDGAYIGKKAMFGLGFPFKDFAINEHVFILRSNEKANQYFLYFLLQQEKLYSLNANSAQPGLNKTSMMNLEITIPPIELIRKFGESVNPLVDKILMNSKQIRTLEKARDLLLPKLISGKVRVKKFIGK